MSTPTSYDSTVNAFYLAFYGRPADPAGLKFWSQALAANNGDLGAITTAFATSIEAQDRFGSDSVGDRISEIYQQLFNRKPDAAGLAYWTEVVEKGATSLADASLAIMNGSQGSDETVVVLRQNAVDAFTAQVEASGSLYEGAASLEAARVLVRAVTADATATDVATLVKSAVSFADIASKNPKVVEAIATGSTLLNLFDTARGTADPVALAQALADTAKAAAGDPVTLEQLLRGGGMNQVLKVMPAAATLKDVVKALAEGGLPAAVEVVYPSKPIVVPTPVASGEFTFKSVQEGDFDLKKGDHVTNKSTADVTFTFEGKNLTGTPTFKYSVDNGVTWHPADGDSKSGIVTIPHLFLGDKLGKLAVPSASAPSTGNIVTIEQPSGKVTTIQLQAFDASGKKLAETTKAIVYDGYVAEPGIKLVNDTFGAKIGSDHDMITKDGAFDPTNIEQSAKVEYAAYVELNNTSSNSNGNTEPEWKKERPELKEGQNKFWIRQTDMAGNQRQSLVEFKLDQTAPQSKAVLILDVDTGGKNDDGITSNGMIKVSNLDPSGVHAWEYSIDGGLNWIYGDEITSVNGMFGVGTIDLGEKSDTFDVQVRQYDAAGNVGVVSDTLHVVLDKDKPVNGIEFLNIDGAAVGVVKTDKSSVDLNFGGAKTVAGETVEWRTKDGEWKAVETIDADGNFSVKDISLTIADQTVQFRVVDLAGNESEVGSVTIDSSVNDAPPPPPMPTSIHGMGVAMGYGSASLNLFAIPYPIITATGAGSEDGLADKASLKLETFGKGVAMPTAQNYFDGADFGLTNSLLKFDATPSLDFYRLSWTSSTFAASSNGQLTAGSAYFIGGQADGALVQGYEVKGNSMLSIGGHGNQSNTAMVSNVYLDTGHAYPTSLPATIHTGGGRDVIVDNDRFDLTIVYDSLDSTSQDVILGFDTGHDVITLDGVIAALVNDVADGRIEWANANVPKFKVLNGIEAVQIALDGQFVADAFGSAHANSVDTLNAALDLKDPGFDGDLLILANNGDSSVLIAYSEKNGNGVIDADEYHVIAVADQGVINRDDIKLVGFSEIVG